MPQHAKTSHRGVLVAASLLALCLLVSLAANVGVTGWGFTTRQDLEQAQARAATLEAEASEAQQTLESVRRELQEAQERAATREARPEQPPAPESTATEIAALPTLDPVDAALMDTAEGQVAALRGLETLRPVERALMTREQLLAYVTGDFEEDFSPQEARDYALTLAAFDALDPDTDLYTLLLQLYAEQIAGFYDPETEQIYVIAGADTMGQMERLIYAHEYTHALQDQHFDLEALGLRDDADKVYDDDHLAAIQALVEGDATLLTQQFLEAHYTPDEMMELLEEMEGIETPVFDAAPEVLSDGLMFPYTHGLIFAQALYDEGGWAAVDRGYADPPRSTEHILHPERYLAGDEPQVVSMPPLTDTLGAGWRQVEANVAGEYFLRYYLAQQLRSREAKAAAEGWGGDRYAVHYRASDGALVLALRVAWDTPADAEEFVDGYAAYAEARFGHAADVTEGARLCWAGDTDTLCLAWRPADTTVVLGSDEATVESLLGVLETD
jgi:hypothetical protein